MNENSDIQEIERDAFNSTIDNSEAAYVSTWMWGIFAVFYILAALLAVVGNALVIYTAQRNTNRGRMRYLDDAIKSLAAADFLSGLIGTPLVLYSYHIGRLKTNLRL